MGDHLPFILYCYIFTILIILYCYIFTILIPGQEHSFYTRNTYVCIGLHIRSCRLTCSEAKVYIYTREWPHVCMYRFLLKFQLNSK